MATASQPSGSSAASTASKAGAAKSKSHIADDCKTGDFDKPTPLQDTRSKEVFRLNVKREQQAKGIMVKTEVDRANMAIRYVDADTYDNAGQYRVIVPALMLFEVRVSNPAFVAPTYEYRRHIRGHFFFYQRYRRQFGFHLCLEADFRTLIMVRILWVSQPTSKTDRFYNVSPQLRPISCVYPCMRDKVSELVLGLVFWDGEWSDTAKTIPKQKYRRSYSRVPGEDSTNPQVFDLTEKFLHPRGNKQIPRCHYTSMFPEDKFAIAFYVCRGARLLVCDNKYNKGNSKIGHTRSLFQQGSVVVVNGTCNLILSVYDKDDLLNKMKWEDFAREYMVPDRSQETMDTLENTWDTQKGKQPYKGPLIWVKRKVLFLGAVESEHNSVCWEMSINDSKDKRSAHHVDLTVPEGGYIEDQTTWNLGFELIRARHRWERLYESVLEKSDGKDLPAQGFEKPTSDEVLMRILGRQNRDKKKFPNDCYARPVVLHINYQGKNVPRDFQVQGHNRDRDVRRYLALRGLSEARATRVESMWFHNERIVKKGHLPDNFFPEPPLYPMIVQKAKGRGLMFRLKDQDSKIIRSSPVADGNGRIADPEDINSMKFADNYRVTAVAVKGEPWKSCTDRQRPDEYSRVGHDYRWQKFETKPSGLSGPEMKALFLVEDDVDGEPWDSQPANDFFELHTIRRLNE